MRSLSPMLARRQETEPVREAAGRPEALRRRTLGTSSRIILGASAVAAPVALYALRQGMLLPFVLSVCGLAIGFIALALHHRGQYEGAAAGQVYGILLVGALLAVIDPAIADFGLAVSLLAPVHASLLCRTPTKKRSWALLVLVVIQPRAGEPVAAGPELSPQLAELFAMEAVLAPAAPLLDEENRTALLHLPATENR